MIKLQKKLKVFTTFNLLTYIFCTLIFAEDKIGEMSHIHKTKKIQTPDSVTKRAGQRSPSNRGGSPDAG